MARIAILTYQAPHRKTQDLIPRLLMSGYKDISLIALPFSYRKEHEPLYPHRPLEPVKISHNDLANCYSLPLFETERSELVKVLEIEAYDYILIGGANIIPDEACNKFNITNAHPSYLPYSRGLDSFKWAIYNGLPLGVTTHIISSEPDTGTLIEKKFVPIYFEDSFYSVANRLYELELDMLVSSISKPQGEQINSDGFTLNKRMPKHKEVIMMQRFNELRLKAKSRLG